MRAEPVLETKWPMSGGCGGGVCLCRCRWGGVGLVSWQGRVCIAISWGAGEQGWAGYVR